MASSGSAAALARGQARSILAERRFHAAPIPRPLHGLLHAVGTAVESPLSALERLVASLAVIAPGGTTTVWGVLAALVLTVSGLLATRGARRTLKPPIASGAVDGIAATMSAAELERAAVAAERQGLHADAVRLRFRSGLMLLVESELVAVAPAMLTAEVSRALHSERFDELARRFEEIAYGGRVATEEDTRSSRREWSRLLGSAGRT
jgi:hypothetical protein